MFISEIRNSHVRNSRIDLKGEQTASSPRSSHHLSHCFQQDEYAPSVLLLQDARISLDAASEIPAVERDLLILAMRLDSDCLGVSKDVALLCGLSEDPLLLVSVWVL
jgi:hypothetical protein